MKSERSSDTDDQSVNKKYNMKINYKITNVIK